MKERDGKTTGVVKGVRQKRIYAANCPLVASHTKTRIYRTDGKRRYCVCDECGTTWRQDDE